jgi:hypothetical protein
MDEPLEDSRRTDIRRLLKTFGVKADEAIIQHMARNPGSAPLQVRITLEEISQPDSNAEPLHFSVEGSIRR